MPLTFNLKNTFFYLLLLFAFNINANNLGNCDFSTGKYLDELSSLDSINSIEININNYRKWTTNTLEAFISRNSSITSEYKKRFLGTVSVNYDFGKCIHDAKIRLHGDWKDHINFEEGGLLNQSVDVSLLNGSIANIIKFKLLLPATRRYENEIILTSMLRLLDFLSPRTSLVNVIINGVDSQMLFQEKTAKELLESMNRREGPLFEGDERFLFNNYRIQTSDTSHLDLENISLAKITNDNWASSNDAASVMALDSFSILQEAYMKYGRDFEDNYVLDWKILSLDNKKFIDKWAAYEILLFSTNSFHALRPHNRKFYFNALENGVEPIYFDGNPRDINTQWLRYIPSFHFYPYLESRHFSELLEQIRLITPKKLTKSTEGNNFKLTLKESEIILEKTIEKIIRLHEMHKKFLLNLENAKLDSFEKISPLENFQNNVRSSIPNSYIVKVQNGHMNHDEKKLLASICRIDNKGCDEQFLDFSMVGKLLERKKFLNIDYDSPLFIEPPKITRDPIISKSFLDGLINIEMTATAGAFFSEEKGELYINLNNINDWIIIRESNLENTSIILESNLVNAEKNNIGSRMNSFGVTGCLTFYNARFKATKIKANGQFSICEDVINIVGSDGIINNLEILNASADGLDVDFSNIEITKLSVFNAKNDCSDFSKGIYKIESAIFKNCGDKGVSVGEQSTFNASLIEIINSNVGISSKDSSKTYIDSLNAEDSQKCAEAFQKKQEFFGAILKISSLNCINQLYFDKNSILEIL
jgi:hypothetical protein